MNNYDYSILENDLKTAMSDQMGYVPVEVIPDGQIHRFSTDSKNPRDKAGWYIAHFDGRPNAVFGDYRTGYKGTWKWDDPNYKPPTPEQRQQQAKQREEVKQARAAQLEVEHLQAALEAYSIWEAAKERKATQAHYYLWRKMCLPYGLGLDENNNLIMPLSDANGHLWSIQTIKPKINKYNKMLLTGAKKQGTFYVLNCKILDLARCHTCYVGEGLATVATYTQHILGLQLEDIGTGEAAVSAVDSGNLEPVIQAIYQKYPHLKFVLIGDDDRLKERETGKNTGKITANAIKDKYPYVVRVDFPPFPPNSPIELSDFNDLYVWQQQTKHKGRVYEPR